LNNKLVTIGATIFAIIMVFVFPVLVYDTTPVLSNFFWDFLNWLAGFVWFIWFIFVIFAVMGLYIVLEMIFENCRKNKINRVRTQIVPNIDRDNIPSIPPLPVSSTLDDKDITKKRIKKKGIKDRLGAIE